MKFTNIRKIEIYDKNKIINVYWKYIIYRIITYIINLFIMFRNIFDIKTNKMHIKLYNTRGDKYFILETNENALSFESLNNNLEINTVKVIDKNIFINFEIINKDNKTCIKNDIIKYQDINNNYNNTIKNILLFNNIIHDDDTILHIRTIINGSIQSLYLPLREINNRHINNII